MAREWTDDEVKGEIAAAVAIVREDRFEAFVRSRVPANTANPADGQSAGNNAGDKGNSNESGNPADQGTGSAKTKSLWWGEV